MPVNALRIALALVFEKVKLRLRMPREIDADANILFMESSPSIED
jgi:hypothetical protein